MILPEITIRKDDGVWIHVTSGKATRLSEAIGAVIETKAKSSTREN
jgi:hypothetical protein